MFVPPSNAVYWMIFPPGLQAEGLFYRDPGPPVSHSGGLLEDGVGVEVSFNRYAHRTQRKRAGTVCCSCKSRLHVEKQSYSLEQFIFFCYFLIFGIFENKSNHMHVLNVFEIFLFYYYYYYVRWKHETKMRNPPVKCDVIFIWPFPPGKVFPVLAIRGQCNIWRLHFGADWRYTVWHLYFERLGAHLQTSA